MITAPLPLKAGDVFLWNDYPLYEHEEKDRWFIFLGNQIIQSLVYEVTTTTQTYHYEQNGKRCKNNFFKLTAGTGGLIKDSIVDLTKYFETIPDSLITTNIDKIIKQGSLSQENINTLARHIKKDADIIGIVKKDIYQCLREAGFKVFL